MEPTIVVAIIGAIEAVTVAFVGGIYAKLSADVKRRADEQDARDEERAERDRIREERDACLYDLMFATASGTEVLLHQAHGDHLNGNVEDALSSIRKAKSECNHIFNRSAASM